VLELVLANPVDMAGVIKEETCDCDLKAVVSALFLGKQSCPEE
jgi:hypothetical protein